MSYGHAYLTSYGWTGNGTGLRKGAIDKPLAIPPKKNLSGLGKDRDDAYPFWDHLFAAASRAITINVSSDDDEDGDEAKDSSSQTDRASAPLRRTATGIISNRRPVSGTPASTSGSTTPNLTSQVADPGRPSLLVTAKREAAKQGLYSRFFRGPVLGPNDDSRVGTSTPLSSDAESKSVSSTVPERVVDRDGVAGDRKQKLGDEAETKMERRERKRLKKERKASRAAEKALARETDKERLDGVGRKARKRQEEKESLSKDKSPHPKKARKKTREPLTGPEDNGQHDARHKQRDGMNVAGAPSVDMTSKKKSGRRKDTPF